MIAAAGTGGHVFPGLAVGEALLDLGVPRDEVVYVGGDRLEATVYPREGFRFLQVRVAGLRRSLTPANLGLPLMVMRARRQIAGDIEARGTKVVLGMGGYVTIPAALAARSVRIPFFNAEQNARAGLANRYTARWAQTSFVSFPTTEGLPAGRWVGNPVRRAFWEFDRDALGPHALRRYELTDAIPTIGVFGGSLGAQAINRAVAGMLEDWDGPPLQVVHLTGESHLEEMSRRSAPRSVTWRRIAFEEEMESFFAACDVAISRAGGAVAELTATATPSILIPGDFGSSGHQLGNARFLEESGAAVIVSQGTLEALGAVVAPLIDDADRRAEMAASARAIAKPDAARTIARAMIEAAE